MRINGLVRFAHDDINDGTDIGIRIAAFLPGSISLVPTHFRFTAEAEGVRLELVSIEEILDLQREEVMKKETEDKAKLKAMKDRGISSDPIQEDFFY